MPGTPPVTPRFGAPRFTQSDLAVFTTDVNPIVDAFDNAAMLSELQAETTRATGVEAELEQDLGELNILIGAVAGDGGEAAARRLGDATEFIQVLSWTDQDSPTQPAGSVLGMVFVPVRTGQPMTLIGAVTRCLTHGAAATQFKVQTDNGHGDGSLSNVTGLTVIEPLAGRGVQQLVTLGGVATPLSLNRYDTVAVTLVVPGNSKGCAVGLLFGRTAPG